ncbi:hypothetical protein GRK10_004231 [Salmonella enterica]|nr:hypothetical protein [Salmonella enterica]
MHKSVVTNNVYIEHRPHPHFCNAIKQGSTERVQWFLLTTGLKIALTRDT